MAGVKHIVETLFDIEMAFGELAKVRLEVARAEQEAPHRLLDALSEPLARLDLIRRLAAGILARHRWEPFTASAGALGPSRPLAGGHKRRAVPSPHRGKPRGRSAVRARAV